MTEESHTVLALSGSLRRASFNRVLLRTAMDVAPAGLRFVEHTLGDIPLYNGDVEAEGFPPSVEAFREAIRGADGVLIVSPEYNHSIPGVLKNALDWASRPPKGPLRGKPAGIMGASDGPIGTARMQAHLRQVAFTLGLRVLPHPEVLLFRAQDKIVDGALTDEASVEIVRKYMAAFARFVRGEG